MAYYMQTHHQPPTSNPSPQSHNHHHHHGGRSRRGPRLSSQNSHKQFRGVRSMKELNETASVTAFRARFEAGRSFDLDDDMEFCPGLLTEDDVSALDYHILVLKANLLASWFRFRLLHPTGPLCPAARLTHRQCNIKSSRVSRSPRAFLYRQPPTPMCPPVFNKHHLR